MFNKLKSSFAFLIISIYIIGMMITFSGDLMQHIQNCRHQAQIQKVANEVTLEFDFEQWKKYNDTKEIYFNNDYYDVISFNKTDSKVIIKAVKDGFESEFRLTLSQIFNKHKLPFSSKKNKKSFDNHLTFNSQKVQNNSLNFVPKASKNFETLFSLKINLFVDIPLKPPC